MRVARAIKYFEWKFGRKSPRGQVGRATRETRRCIKEPFGRGISKSLNGTWPLCSKYKIIHHVGAFVPRNLLCRLEVARYLCVFMACRAVASYVIKYIIEGCQNFLGLVVYMSNFKQFRVSILLWNYCNILCKLSKTMHSNAVLNILDELLCNSFYCCKNCKNI